MLRQSIMQLVMHIPRLPQPKNSMLLGMLLRSGFGPSSVIILATCQCGSGGLCSLVLYCKYVKVQSLCVWVMFE
jgi:hypothetical protein